MSRKRHVVLTSPATIALILLTLLFVGAGAVPALAQIPRSSDDARPSGNAVQGRDGNMYGVGAACGRGSNNTGAVYKITSAGAESVLVNFPAN